MSFFGINWDTFSGLLRNVLLAFGASLVTSGALDQSTLVAIVGGLLALIGAVLSWISNGKKAEAKAVVKAVEVSPLVSVIPADQTTSGKPIIVPAK